jgi:hypothetical protein
MGLVAPPINMLRRFARAARIRTNERINNENRNVWIDDMIPFEKATLEIDNAHAVRLADRAKCPFPYRHPAELCHQPELRASSPKLAILLFDRKGSHLCLVTPRATPRCLPRIGRHGH